MHKPGISRSPRLHAHRIPRWVFSAMVGASLPAIVMIPMGGAIMGVAISLEWLRGKLLAERPDIYGRVSVCLGVAVFLMTTVLVNVFLLRSAQVPVEGLLIFINSLAVITGTLFARVLIGPLLSRGVLALLHRHRNRRLNTMFQLDRAVVSGQKTSDAMLELMRESDARRTGIPTAGSPDGNTASGSTKPKFDID